MKKKKNAMHLAGFDPATTGIYAPECHYRCASLPLLIWSMFDFFQNVSIVLSPTMRISHRVLNCLFENSHILFDGVQLKKSVQLLFEFFCSHSSLNSAFASWRGSGYFFLPFFSTTYYRGTRIRTHNSRVAPDWDL